MSDVVISYNGSDIAEMSETGTKTLNTQGTYLPSNIQVMYTSPMDNVKDLLTAGKNILRNGLPINSITESNASGLTPAEAGWQYARNGVNKVSFNVYAGQYFDVNFITSDGMLQLTKSYQTQGVERHHADELIDLIPLSNITLSFEIKSEAAFSILCKLHAMDSSNVDVMTCYDRTLTYDSAVSDWTKVVINGTVPEDYREEFTNMDNKACRMLFQLSAGGVGHVYLRNFKLEYGDEATLFSLSDYDISSMLTRVSAVPVTAGSYALTATIGEETTKPTFSWDAVSSGGGADSRYDIVVKCTNPSGFTSNASDYVFEVGSFDSVVAKFIAGEAISGIAYCKAESWDDEDELYGGTLTTLNFDDVYLYSGSRTVERYDDCQIFFTHYDLGIKTIMVGSSGKDVIGGGIKRLMLRRNDDSAMPITFVYTEQHT